MMGVRSKIMKELVRLFDGLNNVPTDVHYMNNAQAMQYLIGVRKAKAGILVAELTKNNTVSKPLTMEDD